MDHRAIGYICSEVESNHGTKSSTPAKQRKQNLHLGLTKHLAERRSCLPSIPTSICWDSDNASSVPTGHALICPIFAMQALDCPAFPLLRQRSELAGES